MVSFCKQDFRAFAVAKLSFFATEVNNGIYNNPSVFVSPPVAAPIFNDAQNNFATAAARFKQYGITEKTSFTTAKTNLIAILDSTANYVDSLPLCDESMVVLAGYSVKRDRFKRVLPLDMIPQFSLKRNNVAGDLIVDITPIMERGKINYTCICVEGAPLKNERLINGQLFLTTEGTNIRQDCNTSRRKLFQSLSPGTQYFIYVYAANSLSVSPLSIAMSFWAS